MGTTSRARSALDAERAGGLVFPRHAGCAGARGPGHHPCPAAPALTVTHRFEHPKPHTLRLFVCEAHAVGHPDPRPLAPADRAELRRRRRDVRR